MTRHGVKFGDIDFDTEMYTKAQIDALLARPIAVAQDGVKFGNIAFDTEVYTKAQVDALIAPLLAENGRLRLDFTSYETGVSS
jgi:hypothetical protein